MNEISNHTTIDKLEETREHLEDRYPRVPDELKSIDQWVNWRLDGAGRKIPVNPRNAGQCRRELRELLGLVSFCGGYRHSNPNLVSVLCSPKMIPTPALTWTSVWVREVWSMGDEKILDLTAGMGRAVALRDRAACVGQERVTD